MIHLNIKKLLDLFINKIYFRLSLDKKLIDHLDNLIMVHGFCTMLIQIHPLD